MYHLYDNNRSHLGMAESFEELRAAALQTIQVDGVPHCYIRWKDSSGQTQEARITPASAMPAAAATGMPRRAAPPRGRNSRAARYTNAAIAVVLLFLGLRIAVILLGDPNAATMLNH